MEFVSKKYTRRYLFSQCARAKKIIPLYLFRQVRVKIYQNRNQTRNCVILHTTEITLNILSTHLPMMRFLISRTDRINYSSETSTRLLVHLKILHHGDTSCRLFLQKLSSRYSPLRRSIVLSFSHGSLAQIR